MKSEQEQLNNRGYLHKDFELNYSDLRFEEKQRLLQSKVATERTIGAKLLAEEKGSEAVELLINALIIEKKLYPKMEICNSLVSFGKDSVKPLIALLGKVGANQHKTVPKKDFKKDNYPLPRDIASRTLSGIGKVTVPKLLEVLKSKNKTQLSEAIDALGFICFYDYLPEVCKKLKDCYSKSKDNDLIKWKILRAMSSFPESKTFLQKQKGLLQNDRLKKEIERSLRLINKSVKN